MSFNTRQYFRNWRLFGRGVRWLWTREGVYGSPSAPIATVAQAKWPDLIFYKPGWGPWRFLPVYLTTYLLGTLVGGGVVSISYLAADKPIGRLIDRAFALFGQQDHCANAGPRLWGSKGVWE